jgi:Skp family chaperone for outer membrane proteins
LNTHSLTHSPTHSLTFRTIHQNTITKKIEELNEQRQTARKDRTALVATLKEGNASTKAVRDRRSTLLDKLKLERDRNKIKVGCASPRHSQTTFVAHQYCVLNAT